MRFGQWTFTAQRKGSVLFPASARSERIIRAMPYKKLVMLEARTSRNPAHHDLFWTILDRVVEATGRFPSSDALNDALKFQLGITEEWISLDGEIHIRPGSIAWSAMKQEEFRDYFDRAMAIIAENFYPHMSEEEVKDIEILIGGELAKRAERGGRGEPD